MSSAKLVLEYDFSFDLFGIVSVVKEYKMAWLINNTLGIELAKEEDLLFEFAKKGSMYISTYGFETEYSMLRLFRNKSFEFNDVAKPFLIPELRQYDYLFQYEGESDTFSTEEIIDSLNKNHQIQLINAIDANSLASKENLIC